MKRRLVLLVALGVIAACQGRAPEIDRRVCERVARPYFSAHPDRDVREFRSFDMETQFTIYLCGELRAEPRHLELAEVISERGQGAVDFLVARLDHAESDETIRATIYVFYIMHRRGRYDVSADPSVMELIRTKTAMMRDGSDATLVRDWLEELEHADSDDQEN